VYLPQWIWALELFENWGLQHKILDHWIWMAK